jgi:glycerol-3-phosphate dehydrogenase
LRNKLVYRIGLALNDLVARDRNLGLPDPGTHLPRGRVVSRDEALRLNPVISPDGVTGGAVWYDYQMQSTDRVTLSFLLSALDAGAAAANYVQATRILQEYGRVIGVMAEDRMTGSSFAIRASVVVNAAGPWAASLLRSLPAAAQGTPPPLLSRAMNVVIDKSAGDHACGGFANGRYLFLVPWRDVAIVGTSHDAHDGGPDQLTFTRWDLEAFLKEAREAFPHAPLTFANVRLVHRGLLPTVSANLTRVQLVKESRVVNHERHGVAGLVSMFGVRYTTARQTASEAVDAVFQAMGHTSPPPCRTAETPLHGGSIAHMDNFLKAAVMRDVGGISAATLRRIAATYGTGYDAVLQIARDEPELGRPLGQKCEVIGAEILYAARHEMAVKLADALVRRTEAGAAGHPGADALDAAATIMARSYGWDAARTKNEIAEVEKFYRLPMD